MDGEEMVEEGPEAADTVRGGAVLRDRGVDLLVATAHLVVVVQIGDRVGDIEDFVELSVGHELHDLAHLSFNVGR